MDRSLPAERLLGVIQTQNDIIATALDVDAVMRLVAARAQGLTDAAAAVISLVDGAELAVHVACGSAAAHTGQRVPVGASLSGLCLRTGEVLRCDDARSDGRVDLDACRRLGALSMVCVPLRRQGDDIGVLSVYDPQPHAFDDHDARTLSLLSGVIAAHMSHAAQIAERVHDDLSGLRHRQEFDERLSAEIARVRRHGGELAVAMLDVDDFKQFNDSLGHAAGDELLRAVAAHLTHVREEDAAFRLGGDAFGLILVGTSADEAATVVERIEATVAADPACQGVSISGAVAGLRDLDSPTGLLARADAALYAAKRARRGARATMA